MAEIRTLHAHEMDESMELSAYAFQYELTDELREMRKKALYPDEVMGCFVDGKLAAKLHIKPLQIYVHGQAFSMGGVASVATWPEYRRHGLVGKLMQRALIEMRDRGMSVSLLHPFSYAFYRKYGWEMFVERKQYEIRTDQLPQRSDDDGKIVRYPEPIHHWQVLQKVYDPYAKQYNGMLVRDEKWWKMRLLQRTSGTAAVHFNAASKPDGYMLYEMKNRRMDIKEIVYLNEQARRALWTFISNHDSMAEKVTLIAPANDSLAFALPDPRIEQKIIPFFMARIVDVRSFLLQFPFAAPPEPVQLKFALRDPFAAWNQGMYELAIDAGGQASVTFTPTGETDFDCDIQTLTAMLLGYQTPEFFRQTGRWNLTSEQCRKWEQAVPAAVPYLLDFF